MAKTLLHTTKSWLVKNADAQNLLKSRAVLYFFFIISLINLFSFATTPGNEAYAAIFILVGYLTTFFSKNMIVIMCVGLVTANVLKYGTEVRTIDGFTAGSDNDDTVLISVPSSAKMEDDEKAVSKAEPITAPTTAPITAPATVDTKVIAMKSDKELAAIKGDLNKTMKSMDEKVINPEQKKNIKGLLDLQIKILDGVTGLTPLLNEAKAAVEMIKSTNGGMM